MSRKDRFQAKDKLLQKMTRDGLVQVNAATGEETRISQRGKDFNLQKGKTSGQEAIAPIPGKVQKAPRRLPPLLKDAESIKGANPVTGSELPEDRNKLPDLGQTTQVPPIIQGVSDNRTSEQAEESSLQTENKSGDLLGLRQGLGIEKIRKGPAVPADKAAPQKSTAYYQRFSKDTASPPNDQQPTQTGSTPKPDRLKFSPEEQAAPGRKLARAQKQAENTEKKLEKARSRLPERKKLRVAQAYDEKRKKQRYKICFETEVKSKQSHLKGAMPLRPIKAGVNSMGYAHNKLFQSEQENVGTKAANKGELLAEGGMRTAFRFHKSAPYRRVLV